MISIVSPVYNSQDCLTFLIKSLYTNIKKISKDFEIILVDDFSQDNSWNKIKELKKKYKFIKGIRLSKNYGQQQAIYSGIKACKKKLIIIMDCDLQDNPAYIIKMYELYEKYKMPVIIKHSYKKFSLKHRILSNIFWFLLSVISFKKFSPYCGNYMLIDQNHKKNYVSVKENGYLYGDLLILKTNFIYLNRERSRGLRKKSTYSYFKLFILALKLLLKYNLFSRFFNVAYKQEIKIKEKI
jgi:glycosyltransferase involved in cell wall biosynthesis